MEGFSAHSPARGAAKPKQLVLTPGLTLGVGAEIGPMIEPMKRPQVVISWIHHLCCTLTMTMTITFISYLI